MRGKTVVITGGTSGIGEVAAVALAKMGARIVLVARDKTRGDATVPRLRDSAPGVAHSIHFADLLRLAEMKRVAAQIADHESRIDTLINNAGALFATRRLTEDGLERTFALNHMAYFVMTEGLRERLSASGPARIINTASAAHQGATLDFDDLQSAKSFGVMKAYGRSKLCNILFTRELARRLHGTGVTANCLHPGFVATRFGDQSGGVISHLVWLAKFFVGAPRQTLMGNCTSQPSFTS
jgi:NAD(P)-dependent dehydrogenase (short-subunit alcohol dehydrogenase family)